MLTRDRFSLSLFLLALLETCIWISISLQQEQTNSIPTSDLRVQFLSQFRENLGCALVVPIQASEVPFDQPTGA